MTVAGKRTPKRKLNKTACAGPVDYQELWRTERARAAVPLDASWCHKPAPDFVGPLCPPGQLWFARGRPKDAWQVRAEARIAALSASASEEKPEAARPRENFDIDHSGGPAACYRRASGTVAGGDPPAGEGIDSAAGEWPASGHA
jgi:hypothetical protein